MTPAEHCAEVTMERDRLREDVRALAAALRTFTLLSRSKASACGLSLERRLACAALDRPGVREVERG